MNNRCQVRNCNQETESDEDICDGCRSLNLGEVYHFLLKHANCAGRDADYRLTFNVDVSKHAGSESWNALTDSAVLCKCCSFILQGFEDAMELRPLWNGFDLDNASVRVLLDYNIPMFGITLWFYLVLDHNELEVAIAANAAPIPPCVVCSLDPGAPVAESGCTLQAIPRTLLPVKSQSVLDKYPNSTPFKVYRLLLLTGRLGR